MYSTFEAESSKLCTLNVNDLKLASRLKAERLFISIQDSIQAIKACISYDAKTINFADGSCVDLKNNKLSENFIVNCIEDGLVFIVDEVFHSTDRCFTMHQVRGFQWDLENLCWKPNMDEVNRDMYELLDLLIWYDVDKKKRVGTDLIAKSFYKVMIDVTSIMKDIEYKKDLKEKYFQLITKTNEFTGNNSNHFA